MAIRINMENGMACPNCRSGMKTIDGRMVCPTCGYSYAIPKKLPSYDELLKRNEALEQFLAEFCKVNFIDRFEIEKCQRRAYNLIKWQLPLKDR